MPRPVFRTSLATGDDVLRARARARELAGFLDLPPAARARLGGAVAQLARAAQGSGAELELGVLDGALTVTVLDLDPELLAGERPDLVDIAALARLADRLERAEQGPLPGLRLHFDLPPGGFAPGPDELAAALRDPADERDAQVAELRRQNADLVAALVALRDREQVVDALVRELEQQAHDLRADAERERDALRSLAHELRTPLYAVRGLIEAVLADRPLEAPARADLELVRSAADEALAFVNDHLDLVRLKAGHARVHLRRVDLGELLTTLRVTSEHLPRAAGVALVVEPPGGDVPAVRTDGAKVGQVLRNLVSNALKATSDGEVRVRCERDGPGHVRIAVRDTGPGLTPEEQDRAFGLFGQLGGAPPGGAMAGSGLGLPLSQGLARVLGGELTVDSEPGRGSVFALVLPLEHPPGLPGVEVVAVEGS